MAFCPNCEAEYREGIQRCPDCDLELVEELTPENRVHDRSDAQPVVFQSFKTSAEAELVRDLLEQNGVRAFVEGSEFAVIPGSFSAEVVLMVDERDLERAKEVYEAYFNAPADEYQSDNQ